MSEATKGVKVDAARAGRGKHRVQEGGPGSPEPASQPMANFPAAESETLSRQQFLKQLQVEKRRSDRIQSPLSLVVVHADAERGAGLPFVQNLLELFGTTKRETDILGYIAEDKVALLLPHTGEQGVQAFITSVGTYLSEYPISISTATYPDHVFDSLISESAKDFSDTLTYFINEQTGRSPSSEFIKRCVDIVGALTALLLFSPFMLVTAIAVAVTSPGPVIFRQTRLGRRGTPFVFYKFRSMRANSDDRIHREYVADLIRGNHKDINQGDDERPLYKLSADPRVTPVGRFIRRTSLDELPQLFNVLKGDMSLVGPRPPLPYEAEKYQSWHLRRVLEVRPGITGLWQVEGRSTTSFDDMVRLDLRYIRHRSFWLDAKILLKTVRVFFGGSGAT